MSRQEIAGVNEVQETLDAIHQRLSDRLSVSSYAPCPVESTAALIGLCKANSCGKCTPCRIGLPQLENLVNDVLDGWADESTLKLIETTAQAIYDSADCAIGFEAAAVALEAVKGFRDDFEYHIQHKNCGMNRPPAIPCIKGCPAGVDIPGYIACVAAGRNTDAVRVIRKDNPLPIVCGLICEHPCEDNCRRGMLDDVMNIRGIKRYATDNMEYDYTPAHADPTGKTVAVIGGGPAGLTAAYYLTLMGHECTIFEQRKHLGGMMRYGIPAYRLPRERMQEQIDWIINQGIEVKYETRVGVDVTFDELRRDFDAVYIAIGAHADNKLGVPGEDAEGVISAVEMLRKIGDLDMPDYSGKRVVVIGGGNVAMDVARSSIRSGAKSVDIVYRRRRVDMTALPDEIEGAVAEGCELDELMAPLEVVTEDGKVVGMKVQPQIIGEKVRGRYAPRDADVEPRVIPCDLVLVAVGQKIDSGYFEEQGLPCKRGVFQANPDGSIDGFEGVFVGGDCESSPATVILAVAAGKVAAANIDEYLGFNHTIELDVEIPPATAKHHIYTARSSMRERAAEERKDDFDLMEVQYTKEEAMQECSRCLRCDHYGLASFRGGRSFSW